MWRHVKVHIMLWPWPISNWQTSNLHPYSSVPWLPPPGKIDVFSEGQTSGSLQLRLQSVTLELCRWNNRRCKPIALAKMVAARPKHTNLIMNSVVRKFFAALPKTTQPTQIVMALRWPFHATSCNKDLSHGTSIARCDRRPWKRSASPGRCSGSFSCLALRGNWNRALKWCVKNLISPENDDLLWMFLFMILFRDKNTVVQYWISFETSISFNKSPTVSRRCQHTSGSQWHRRNSPGVTGARSHAKTSSGLQESRRVSHGPPAHRGYSAIRHSSPNSSAHSNPITICKIWYINCKIQI